MVDGATDRQPRSVIEIHQRSDARVSTIRRPDGSILTVTVPASAMDDDTGRHDATESWIREDDTGGEPPAAGLRRLAMIVTAGRMPRPASVDVSLLAFRMP